MNEFLPTPIMKTRVSDPFLLIILTPFYDGNTNIYERFLHYETVLISILMQTG
jgi:hypothetical protein